MFGPLRDNPPKHWRVRRPEWARELSDDPHNYEHEKFGENLYAAIIADDGTEWFVPLNECDECGGSGEVQCEYGHDHECRTCDGSGFSDDAIAMNWSGAVLGEEVRERWREERYLEQRYGTSRPSSIVDYWLKPKQEAT